MIAVLLVLVAAIWPSILHAEYFIPNSLGGSLTYGYGYSRIATSESEQSNVTLSLYGGGYFWQPWFLTMGAGVGLGLSQAGSTASSGSGAKSISGNIDFNLFPESRFPTSFGYSVSDSRQEVKDNIFSGVQSSQNRRFYLRQSYTTPSGADVNGWFNRNSGSSTNQVGESIDQSLGFQFRKRVPYHDFSLGGGYVENSPAQSDIVSSNSNLLLNHNFSPSAEVGANSSVSYSEAATTGGGLQKFSTAYEQASTSFSWRPEHRPYFISGGALIYTVLSGTESRGVSTSANAAYQFARNLSVTAGLNVTVADTDGSQIIASSQSLGTNIPSDQYTIFGFDWGWNVGLGFNNSIRRSDTSAVASADSTAAQNKDQRSLNLSLSHHLARAINLGRNSGMNVSFSQGASGSGSSNTDSVTRSLSTSVSLGWNHTGYGGSTSANTSASDSRSYGREGTAFQLFNAQLARNQSLSRLSSLSGNINFQANRARAPVNDATSVGDPAAADSSTTTKSASAGFSYTHSRFLGLHGLMLSSSLSVPTLINDERTQSASGKDWDNTLNYRIGLLGLSLTARVSESGVGQRAYSMTFSAVRSF